MNYDWSHFHPGHTRTITSHAGSSLINCLDCGVSANLEAVSAKISVPDAHLVEASAKERKSIGQLSEGTDFRGKV